MQTTEIDRLALAVHALRPDWPALSLRTFITNQRTADGLALASMAFRDVAVAFAWVAADPTTRVPSRVLERGDWWSACQPKSEGSPTHLPPPVHESGTCMTCRLSQAQHDRANRLAHPDEQHEWRPR